MRRTLPFSIFLVLVTLAACERSAPRAPAATAPTPAAATATPVAATTPPDLAPVPPPAPKFVPSDIPRFDVHTHIEVGALPKAIALFRAHGIEHIVNQSGG